MIRRQDLKTASFDPFFSSINQACLKHLGDEDGQCYFGLLASQLAQRMLKGPVKTQTKEPAKDLPYFMKFLQEMKKAMADDDNLFAADVDHSRVLQAVITIMDVASIPSSVQASGEFLGKSDHWLAQALKLDKGKKAVQLALENATNREQQNGILEKISKAQSDLEEQAVTEVDQLTMTLDNTYGKMFLGCHSSQSNFTSLFVGPLSNETNNI